MAPRIVRQVVNGRAKQRYATFRNCLLGVDAILGDADRIARRMVDAGTGVDGVPWHVATESDIRKAIRRVETALQTLSKSGKRWEAELISRDWRK